MVRLAVIIVWQFVNQSGMSVALNEGSLGFPPLRCEALRAPPIYTSCYAFSLLFPSLLFKFSLCQAYILKGVRLLVFDRPSSLEPQ